MPSLNIRIRDGPLAGLDALLLGVAASAVSSATASTRADPSCAVGTTRDIGAAVPGTDEMVGCMDAVTLC